MLFVIVISIKTIQYLRHTVSIGNRFPCLYINFVSVSLIPVYHHRIWKFSMMGVKRGGWWGLHVSKQKGDIKKGGLKRKGAADTPFRAMLRLLKTPISKSAFSSYSNGRLGYFLFVFWFLCFYVFMFLCLIFCSMFWIQCHS